MFIFLTEDVNVTRVFFNRISSTFEIVNQSLHRPLRKDTKDEENSVIEDRNTPLKQVQEVVIGVIPNVLDQKMEIPFIYFLFYVLM